MEHGILGSEELLMKAKKLKPAEVRRRIKDLELVRTVIYQTCAEWLKASTRKIGEVQSLGPHQRVTSNVDLDCLYQCKDCGKTFWR